jgi:predicted enzyme related to lactoylglutathione lyase
VCERIGGDGRRVTRALGVAGRKTGLRLLSVADRFLGCGYELVELGGDVVVLSDQIPFLRGRNRTLRRERTAFKTSDSAMSGVHMKRVTGIGGIFFTAKDPAALQDWYKEHLGIDVQPWGGAAFDWTDEAGTPVGGTTAWNVVPADGDAFAPSTAPFMVNYRVADLRALVAALEEEGCEVVGGVEESDYGTFGWVIDPEGNKVELWEPPAGG